jgi:formylglycine-generating enzyme required for sulfatase activity
MMRSREARFSWLPLAAAFLSLAPAASAVTIDWVTVGDPGNPADTQVMGDGTTGYGAVAYSYRIGKYEVTNAQYVEFLNGKAASDPLLLFNSGENHIHQGIFRSGSPGSYTYSAVAGREDWPVNHVSFYDALRFANWLYNGQGDGDTETGAYTLLGGTYVPSNGATVTRNAGAKIFLTSEDEWYKAAYYDAATTSYHAYPFADGFNGAACEVPAGSTSHSANCDGIVGDDIFSFPTDVGAYINSPSPSGTFDQLGNVWEWNEAIANNTYKHRSLRGASFRDGIQSLSSSSRANAPPASENMHIGFRVATVIPEPSTGLLLAGGIAALSAVRRRHYRSLKYRTSFNTIIFVAVLVLGPKPGFGTTVNVDLDGAPSGTLVVGLGASFAQTFMGQTVVDSRGISGVPDAPLALDPAGGMLIVDIIDTGVSPATETLHPQPELIAPLSVLLDSPATSVSWIMGLAQNGTVDIDFFDPAGNLVNSVHQALVPGYNFYTYGAFGAFSGFTIFNNMDRRGLRYTTFSYQAVPEPSTALLLATGLAAIAVRRRTTPH